MMRFAPSSTAWMFCLATLIGLASAPALMAQDNPQDKPQNRPLMLSHNFTTDRHGWRSWPQDQGPKLTPDAQQLYQGKPTLKVVATPAADKGLLYRYSPLQPGKLHEVIIVTRSRQNGRDAELPYRLQISFNKEGGGNGSAGIYRQPQVTADLTADAQGWQIHRLHFMAPEDAVTGQFILSVKASAAPFWIGQVVLQVDPALAVPSASPALNADPDAPAWQDIPALAGFWQVDRQAAQAQVPTQVKIAYDDRYLHVMFINHEDNPDSLSRKVTQRDGPLWQDDCNELFIAIPGGQVRQFIVNAAGVQWDGNLYQRADGDPWRADSSWDGQWSASASIQGSRWVSQFRIPFEDLGDKPAPGKTWRINFARERKTGLPELTHWNRFDGNFNQVDRFATLTFNSAGQATLERFAMAVIDQPLHIDRPARLYRELLTDEPGRFITGEWAQPFYLSYYPATVKEQHTPQSWRVEQDKYFARRGPVGMFGPSLPWVAMPTNYGYKNIMEVHEQYGMRFPYVMFSSAVSRLAIAQGATYINSLNYVTEFDPAKVKVVAQQAESFFNQYPDAADIVAFTEGVDEPTNHMFNTFSYTLNPERKAMLDEVDAAIRTQFGGGRHGLFDHADPADAARPDAPFRRIAYAKWWNERFAWWTQQIHDIAKRHAPHAPFVAVNTNTVSGIAMLDMTLAVQTSDWTSADPYPTSTLAFYGRPRALYHVGFTTKFINDLSSGKRTRIVPQNFIYHGRGPTPADSREWISQALKNGASIIHWYGDGPPNLTIPEAYEESLQINAQLKTMNRIKLPDQTRTAIFFSLNPQAARHDTTLHAAYTVYTLLGERLGSWFRFVSDTQLTLGLDTLDRYDLIYLPQGAYLDRPIARKLVDRVQAGATLVVLDPESFHLDALGDSLDDLRQTLLGGRLLAPRQADHLTLRPDALAGLEAGSTTLPLTPVTHQVNAGSVLAYNVATPTDAKVLATYPDGDVAAYVRQVGKGRVVYFAAQPFGNADLAIADSAWLDLFKTLAKQAGEPLDQPIWRFYLQKENQ